MNEQTVTFSKKTWKFFSWKRCISSEIAISHKFVEKIYYNDTVEWIFQARAIDLNASKNFHLKAQNQLYMYDYVYDG